VIEHLEQWDLVLVDSDIGPSGFGVLDGDGDPAEPLVRLGPDLIHRAVLETKYLHLEGAVRAKHLVHLVDGSIKDDLAFVDDGDALAERLNVSQVVGGQDDGGVVGSV
jgi:hypothetical protein